MPATAELPVYGLGDSYRFSDGGAETVVSASPDAVHWQGRGGTYTTARDILLPPLAWNNAVVRGERRIAVGSAQLFPLQAGRSVAFTAARAVRPATGGRAVTATENWQCQVTGAAPIQTRAGRFATWRVECLMTVQQGTAQAGAQRGGTERYAYNYAPDIGFYVRREETTGDGSPLVADLVAFTSAEPAMTEAVLRQRSLAIQHTLEKELSGARTPWSDPATGDSGDVQVLNTMRSERYGYCREFDERIRANGRLYHLGGTGCRDPSGLWSIVMTPGGPAG